MLGFGDFWVAAAYILCILSSLLCVVYGLLHWNDDEDLPSSGHPKDENLEFEDEV